MADTTATTASDTVMIDGKETTKSARMKQVKQIIIWSLVFLGALVVISKLTDEKVPIVD